jgi:DNA-binding GntR family transcriptional regulator
MDSTENLQRTFVREKAYLLLRDWIVKGKLEPCQRLRDKVLAEQLGVSRTPIREALLRLEDEGLVQTKPNSSTLVSPIDLQNALNLYSIVWTLEGLAMKQSFELITNENIECMIEANEKLLQRLKAQEVLLAIDADNDFHSIYIQISQNVELCQMLSIVKQKINRLKCYYFHEVKNTFLSYEEHLSIIEALKKKNLSLALDAVESNWKASCARIISQGPSFKAGSS